MIASLVVIVFTLVTFQIVKWIKEEQDRETNLKGGEMREPYRGKRGTALVTQGRWILDLHRAVYFFVALAFVVRLLVRFHSGADEFWVTGYKFFFDTAQAIAAGKGIASADGLPESFRVPFYSILLSGLTLGRQIYWPIVIAESAIGAGTAYCAALLSREMFSGLAGEKAAMIAAAVTALYPYYVVHDTALQETSLFTILTILCVLVLMRTARSGGKLAAATAGMLLGLDVLTRLAIVPVAVIAPIWLIWQKKPKAGIICAAFLALTTSPWLWRNYLLEGTPTLSTESGMQFWSGNNGFLFLHYPRESRDVSTDEAMAAMSSQDKSELRQLKSDRVATDQWYRHKAYVYIFAHPWQTIIDGFRKNFAGFWLLPSPRHGRASDLVHAASYGPVMLFGIWGMWRRRSRWREDSLIYLLFITFTMITAAYWAHTSHRSYLDVYWIVIGSGTLVELIAVRKIPPAQGKFMAQSDVKRPELVASR